MSTPFNISGHSTSQRTIERECEDAMSTGKINFSCRKLKEIPKVILEHDLSDTTDLDISKNRFSDLPKEVCDFLSLEYLNCYHNVIKCIPNAIQHLQSLVHLDLSRNHLAAIPTGVCKLQSLEVLLISNNKMTSLPEEIGGLESLTELDLSCNQISYVPTTISRLSSLRYLNLRKNQLVEMSTGICQLKLRKLDISCNKISTIPFEFQKMDTIEELHLGDNPLICPPAQICTKGYVHVLKYLHSESLKEDRRRGIFSEMDLRKPHKHAWQQDQKASALKYGGNEGIEFEVGRRPYSSTIDSGYNTNVETSDKMSVNTPDSSSSSRYEIFTPPSPANTSGNDSMSQASYVSSYTEEPQALAQTSPAAATIPYGQVLEPPSPKSAQGDPFSQELQRQKADYDARKRRAEKIRLEREYQHKDRSYTTPTEEKEQTMPDIRQTKPDPSVAEPLPSHYMTRGSEPTMGHPFPVMSQFAINAEEEFRRRHEDMIAAQRREAQLLRERMDNEKERIRKMQKEAVFSFVQRSHDIRNRDDNYNTGPQYAPTTNIAYTNSPQNRLPYRCQQALQSMSTELSNIDPAFTIRRNIQMASEEVDLIHLLRQTIEDRLKITLPEDLSAALRDGVVLCHLANHIRPRSVSSIHVPSPAVPKLTAAKCRKNVENFLEACMKIGVNQSDLCPASAIQEEHGIVLVARTVKHLLDCVLPPQFSTV